MGQARVVAGRYELIRPLGRGGMGAVWLGQDVLAGRQVAVKELRAPGGASEGDRDVFRQRALHEARSAPAGGGITENVYAGPSPSGRPGFSGELSRAA